MPYIPDAVPTQVAQNAWLSLWSNATAAAKGGHIADDESHYYLHVYFYLGLGSLACSWIRSYTLVEGSVAATRSLHARLLAKVMLKLMRQAGIGVGVQNLL